MLCQRSAGILLHPTSLPSLGGIGDLGPEAYAFADFLGRSGLGLWQVLPLSPPGLGNSPYSGLSAFAGNPLRISLVRLAERGCVEEGQGKRLTPPHNRVTFDDVKAGKMPLVQRAAQTFLELVNGDLDRFTAFKRDHAWWLEEFVLFDVMRQVHAGRTWSEWPKELARRE